MYRAGLRPAQHRLLLAIEDLTDGQGRSPSVRELICQLGLSSPAPIQRSLEILETDGFISRQARTPRTITVLKTPSQSLLYGELNLEQAKIIPCEPVVIPTPGDLPCLGLRLTQGEPSQMRAAGDILLLYSNRLHDELPQEFLGRTFENGHEIYRLRSARDGCLTFRLLSIWRDLGSL